MTAERFGKFTLLIDGIYKSIGRVKFDVAPDLGIKSVHVFWLYALSESPEGLSSAELAQASSVDRSLVSREIAYLRAKGYITTGSQGSKRGYNSRHILTDDGRALAEKLRERALEIQNKVGKDITEEELGNFYKTLEKIHTNFAKITSGDRSCISLGTDKLSGKDKK